MLSDSVAGAWRANCPNWSVSALKRVSQVALVVKKKKNKLACQCRRHKRFGFNPWIGKIPWRRHGNPLQDSCLDNPMDRGAWWATVHGVAKTEAT